MSKDNYIHMRAEKAVKDQIERYGKKGFFPAKNMTGVIMWALVEAGVIKKLEAKKKKKKVKGVLFTHKIQ